MLQNIKNGLNFYFQAKDTTTKKIAANHANMMQCDAKKWNTLYATFRIRVMYDIY